MKDQPAIIEVTRSEGDNEINFSLRGSAEWLAAHDHLVNFTLGAITGDIWKNANEAERQELVDAVKAIQSRQSYQGQFVKIHIAQNQ